MSLRDWVGIVAGGAIGFCLAKWLATSTPDDWETLVVGIVAVLATFLTIRKMQDTILVTVNNEERAQLRHEQLMRHNLRSDKLRIDRAVAELEIIHSNLESNVALIVRTLEANNARDTPEAKDAIQRVLAVARNMLEGFQGSRAIAEAVSLMSPPAYQTYSTSLTWTQMLLKTVKNQVDADVNTMGTMLDAEAQMLGQLLKQLRALTAEYSEPHA